MTRQSQATQRALTQAGVALFLIGLITGFFIHGALLPRLALGAHLMAIMGGIFMIALGSIWPQLKLGSVELRIALGLAVYGLYAGWLVYLLASIWNAGGMFPLAVGQRGGTAFEEAFVMTSLMTVAGALIGLCLLLLWGLRRDSPEAKAAEAHSEQTRRRP